MVEKNDIELLRKAGLPRRTAITLLFLRENDGTTARDIESVMNLRQPEVSLAIQELKGKGWIKIMPERVIGKKGRPLHRYALAKDFKHIIETFHENLRLKVKEIEGQMEQLDKLRGL